MKWDGHVPLHQFVVEHVFAYDFICLFFDIVYELRHMPSQKKPDLFAQLLLFFYLLTIIYSVQGMDQFQPSVVCSFKITMLESRKNKEINLYSDYTKNILQPLAFAAITSVWISLQSWNLAYNVHHGLADQPMYSFSLAVTSA